MRNVDLADLANLSDTNLFRADPSIIINNSQTAGQAHPSVLAMPASELLLEGLLPNSETLSGSKLSDW